MTNVFWNDLKLLKDIIDDIEVKDLEVNEKDIDDLKESICYFINDILTNNIHIYSDKHFDEILFEEVLDTINKTYYNAIDLSSFDLDGQVWDAIQIYFYKHNAFRSYSNTTIINKPNNKKVKKLLEEYLNTPQLEQRSKEWFRVRY